MTNITKSVKDLVVLTADADMLATIDTLLRRSESLGIRDVSFDVERHLLRDAGCRAHASSWLRAHIRNYQYAIVMFDHHGCGSQKPRASIQEDVEQDLSRNGWPDRSKAIVVEPELEAWVWNSSQGTAEALGWANYAGLRSWLNKRRLWPAADIKPPDPKEALKRVMEDRKLPRSSTLFEDMASHVQMDGCQDAAFLELKTTLQNWFSD